MVSMLFKYKACECLLLKNSYSFEPINKVAGGGISSCSPIKRTRIPMKPIVDPY
jgi:hypothetical protein